MSELTEDEIREPTLAYIAKLEARNEQLEAALKEAGEMWIRKDNRIEALDAALKMGIRTADDFERPVVRLTKPVKAEQYYDSGSDRRNPT